MLNDIQTDPSVIDWPKLRISRRDTTDEIKPTCVRISFVFELSVVTCRWKHLEDHIAG